MKSQRKKLVNSKDKTPKQKKEKNVETPDNLEALLKEHQRKVVLLQNKIVRLKDLLSRKSVFKISETKKEKMKKQLLEAEDDFSFSLHAIDQISFRITQIT